MPPEVSTAPSPPTCPSCGGLESGFSFRCRGFDIWSCSGCRHRFTPVMRGVAHVSDVYGDDYFTGGGAGYADYLAEGPLLRAHGRRYGELLRGRAAPGRLLDVGAAAGYVLRGLMDAGFQGEGLEPNETMVRYARDQVGVEVRRGTLEDTDIAGPFDAITMIQVIGHFYDLERALSTAARLTRNGGLWLVEAWDYGSVVATLLGPRWHEYSPPSVVHWFTPESLRALARRHGFVEVVHGRPKKYLALGHAASLMSHALGPIGRLVPAKLVESRVSLRYPALDLFFSIFEKRTHTQGGTHEQPLRSA